TAIRSSNVRFGPSPFVPQMNIPVNPSPTNLSTMGGMPSRCSDPSWWNVAKVAAISPFIFLILSNLFDFVLFPYLLLPLPLVGPKRRCRQSCRIIQIAHHPVFEGVADAYRIGNLLCAYQYFILSRDTGIGGEEHPIRPGHFKVFQVPARGGQTIRHTVKTQAGDSSIHLHAGKYRSKHRSTFLLI